MSAGGVAHSLDVLRQFAGRRRAVESCELCGLELAGDHPHLVEPKTRKLVCSCNACAILFGGQSGAKYKRVPGRIRYLADFRLSGAQWESLMIPINMAFLFESSAAAKVVALYPSPAGAAESQLPLDTWSEILAENPALADMGTDVEALLVNRLGPARGYPEDEYYLLPIDECYKLVWLIRKHWHGLSGGPELWQQLEAYFSGLKMRAGAWHA